MIQNDKEKEREIKKLKIKEKELRMVEIKTSLDHPSFPQLPQAHRYLCSAELLLKFLKAK